MIFANYNVTVCNIFIQTFHMARPSQQLDLALLEAGEEELRLKGVRGLSVRAVCARAGVSPRMLNYYFESKDNFGPHPAGAGLQELLPRGGRKRARNRCTAGPPAPGSARLPAPHHRGQADPAQSHLRCLRGRTGCFGNSAGTQQPYPHHVWADGGRMAQGRSAQG